MSETDDIEYHVTFPTQFSGNPTGAADQDIKDVSSEEKNSNGPVIFLLGWYGCQDKHLAKYSAIYESKGYITIRYTLPSAYMFSGRGNIRDVAFKVLESFFDLGLEDNTIFFHAFSNGGGYIYRYITEILHGPNPGRYAALRIAGVVLDSLPCLPTASSAYKAIKSTMPAKQHWIVSSLQGFLIWFVFIIMSFLPHYWDKNKQRTTYFNAMLSDKISCPQLFLYSKADEIVSYKNIMDMICARRRGGFEVREVLWEDSGHVAHLLKHREEYMTACLEFVADGLEVIDQEIK